MAEVVAAVAVISSFVQLADSSAKLASRIHEYIRQTESAPKNLCRIYDLLPVFIEALKWIEDPVVLSDLDPGTQSTMRQLIDRRSSQLTGLEAMVTKLMPGRSDSKRRRVYKAFLSTKDERNLEKISCDIKDDIHMLISLSNLIVSVQNSRISSESPKSSKLISLPTINTSVEKGGTQSLDIANTSPRTRFRSFAGQYNRDQRREYSYFFGLAKLGLMYAFQAKLEISWGRPTFSITPSLSLQPLVKRTSPGAVIFYRFLHTGDDNKLSSLQFMSNKLAKQALSESCLVLSRNLMSKKLSPWDVFPSGLTLLEEILHTSSMYAPEICVEFMKVLCDFGAHERVSKPLLKIVAMWRFSPNGEGIHLRLLQMLLGAGYDCSADGFYHAAPNETCISGAYLGYFKNHRCDHFLLEFQRICSHNCYGVWGQTPLTDSILCESEEQILHIADCSSSLAGQNFLGQTAAHFAVLRPDILSKLLQAYPAFVSLLHIPDISGYYPLDYAAAYKLTDSLSIILEAAPNAPGELCLEYAAINECTESIRLLLNNKRLLGLGRNLNPQQYVSNLNFLLHCKEMNTIRQTFDFLRAQRDSNDSWLKREVCSLTAHFTGGSSLSPSREPELLRLMFENGLDKHMLFEDYSHWGHGTLLNHAPGSEWIDCLMENEFALINHRDSLGRTALITFASHGYADRALTLMDHGCDLNSQDNEGKTAIYILIGKLGPEYRHRYSARDPYQRNPFYFGGIAYYLTFAACLLHQGADVSIRDHCFCFCVPDGCSPLLQLLGREASRPFEKAACALWVLELLMMIDELQGSTVAHQSVDDMVRLDEFQSLDMTHVCCRWSHGFKGRHWKSANEIEQDIDEIVDEEREFGVLLDETMSGMPFSQHRDSVQERWLALLPNFGARKILFPGSTEEGWFRYDASPMQNTTTAPEQVTLPLEERKTGDLEVDEDRDIFWRYYGSTVGDHETIEDVRHLYSDWVEWVYHNPGKYKYPLPLDKEWYEKRRYWAARQAEVLSALP